MNLLSLDGSFAGIHSLGVIVSQSAAFASSLGGHSRNPGKVEVQVSTGHFKVSVKVSVKVSQGDLGEPRVSRGGLRQTH